MAGLGAFKIPHINNEPTNHYAKGSIERQKLRLAVDELKQKAPINVPITIAGQEVKANSVASQAVPSSHAISLAKYATVSGNEISAAIEAALQAKAFWEEWSFADRSAVFLKAADLISGKYRYEIMAATMVGQGKNAWQAEIESAAELCDFLRFNVQYAQDMYSHQPVHNAPGAWNRVEYRPLEGFVYAIAPFNFTAIGGNLPAAPALMGNVVLWKPSPSAVYSNYLVYRIFLEAGLPPNVIQFVPGDAVEITRAALGHRQFAALHYTGSTAVFRSLYGQIASSVADGRYDSYPRIVGETGGKNFHLIHHSADLRNAVVNTVRGAFEYQGQKCSACSRAFVPASLADAFIKELVTETRKLKVGDPADFANFVGPVIHEASFKKLADVIDAAKNDKDLELLVGGTYDGSHGYYIQPTVYKTSNPVHELMTRELFGPILCLHVYDDSVPTAFADICQTIDTATPYALTGAVFAQDRDVLRFAEKALRNSAGNFYLNCKCTGAVVAQQPFGGARASGTNDKAGSANLLSRFVSMRAIKEDFVGSESVEYPSNEV